MPLQDIYAKLLLCCLLACIRCARVFAALAEELSLSYSLPVNKRNGRIRLHQKGFRVDSLSGRWPSGGHAVDGWSNLGRRRVWVRFGAGGMANRHTGAVGPCQTLTTAGSVGNSSRALKKRERALSWQDTR